MTQIPTIRVGNPELPAEIEAIIAAVEAMTAAMDNVRARLESGESVLIEGLDVRMRTVYDAVERTEGDDVSPRLLPPLRVMAASLERLEAALRQHVPKPPPSAPARKGAEAYGAAGPRVVPFKPRNR
ncbi:MAG: hypothetical protein WCO00_17790 [Rhodospirillaceae bacterium]